MRTPKPRPDAARALDLPPSAADAPADTAAGTAGATRADPAVAADPQQFETALAELEALVDRLEQGDLTLEASLTAFERGVLLTRACQQALDQAEQRVRILTDSDPDAPPEPFDPGAWRADA